MTVMDSNKNVQAAERQVLPHLSASVQTAPRGMSYVATVVDATPLWKHLTRVGNTPSGKLPQFCGGGCRHPARAASRQRRLYVEAAPSCREVT